MIQTYYSGNLHLHNGQGVSSDFRHFSANQWVAGVIFIRYSTDSGATWNLLPIQVNSASVRSQFMPAISVDQTTGIAAISWYDSRNSATNQGTQIYGTVYAVPGNPYGLSAPSDLEVRIGQGISDAHLFAAGPGAGFNYGEYNEVSYTNSRFFAVWADNSDSTPDYNNDPVRSMDVYTARVDIQYLASAGGAPDAHDSVANAEGQPVTINVLADDYDPDGDVVTLTVVGTPGHGTATANSDQTVTYMPTTGTTATVDTFTYTVTDGSGGSSTATVTVFLADQPPVAVPVSASPHGAAVTVNVLAGDTDPNGFPLTVTALGTPAYGTAVINGDNSVTYTPASGTTATVDSFTYTISDGDGGTSSATVSVYLADRAPTAMDAFASHGNAAVTIDVLAEDYDVDGDSLTVTGVGTPTHGTAVVNADNSVTYTPSVGTTATVDAFSYTVSDGYGGTSSATVTVDIADLAPVANNISISHGNVAVTADVLMYDSDPEGDALTVTSVGSPSSGTAVVNGDGTLTYTPAMGTTASQDSFSYTITDGHGGSSSATVSVFIANRAPAANGDAVYHATAAVSIDVLANDNDLDGDALTVTSVGTPSHGTAAINSDGTVSYTPTTGTTATTDAFTYSISDGNGGTSSATVSVYIANQAPVANDDVAVHATAAVTIDVLANDYDPDNDPLTITSVGTPSNGTAVLNSDGSVTYTPTSGTTATTDSFTYSISDGNGGTSSATVSVFIANRAPVAVNDTAVHVTSAVTVNVLLNDYDPDADNLTVTSVGTPSGGTAVLNSDGSVTYTPSSGTVSDSFTYTIADGYGGTSTATVNIYVTNRAPIAAGDSVTDAGAVPITISVLANDSDPDSDHLTVTAISMSGMLGTETINSDGTITYTPNSGVSSGIDEFEYTISDGHGGTSYAFVTINIT